MKKYIKRNGKRYEYSGWSRYLPDAVEYTDKRRAECYEVILIQGNSEVTGYSGWLSYERKNEKV